MMNFAIEICSIRLKFIEEVIMETLKYKVIKTEEQYKQYCSKLEDLLEKENSSQDEIELLTLLIEKWDQEHNSFEDQDPVELIHSLMKENNLKSKDLVSILGVSKGLVSDILNYKKGLSKEIIRTLSNHFKLSQEAFNRPYKLKLAINTHLKNASLMNTHKKVVQTR
jgi:HTH-type transcriptional regulator / antitoxin HigA